MILLGCSKSERAIEVFNDEVPRNQGEIQVVIEPEYDHYYFGENIWLKVTIMNNTDEDFYLTYLPDVLSLPLLIFNDNGTRIYSRENDERMRSSDSTKVPPHTDFNSLINLSDYYFPQRKVTKGVYIISGEYEKYPHRKFLSATQIHRSITIDYPPAIKTNTIKILISPTAERENELYNQLFWNTGEKFTDNLERYKFLTNEYPDSKFYPQIYSEYIYYLQNDSSQFFENVDYFFNNIDSFESIRILHTLESYLRQKLNWDYEERRNYFISLKNKYRGEKLGQCIDYKLATAERYGKPIH